MQKRQVKTDVKPSRIFIAATRQNDGKTTVSLGLIAALQKRYNNVGFIKPVGQRYLIENGIKFNDQSDGVREVRIMAEASGDHDKWLRFSVADNGPGVAGEDQPRIFEKFYQIDDDFTGQIEGLGLGLTYVKCVAEAHGGRWGVNSQPGEGSTFYIELPC